MSIPASHLDRQVTFNYRLGALGWFYLGTETEVTGNQGLHDMVAALQWVQTNIAQFGGDPDLVTIFGESAGSWACSFLSVSPLAQVNITDLNPLRGGGGGVSIIQGAK